MNPIFRLFALLSLALVALPVQAADTMIDQLYGLRNYELADAYWAAGQKFVDLGQADRGAEFKAKALRIFPGYVPGQAPQVQAPKPVVEAPHVPAATEVREANVQGEKITRLQFQKLLRGYLTGSAATVTAVLDPGLQVQGQSAEFSANSIAAFFTDHPATAGTPGELFLTDTLELTDGPGQSVLLTITANPESEALSALLPFWKPTQTYTFDRVGDTWKLKKIDGR